MSTPSMPDTPAAFRRRQITVVAAAASGLFVAYPATFGTSYVAFLDPLSDAFGGSKTIPSLGFAMATLGQAVGAFLIGPLLRRYRQTRVLAFALPVFSLLVLCMALIPAERLPFLVLNFAIGLASAGAGVGVYLSVVNQWFDAALGRAVGFALLGMSSGMLVLPVFAQVSIGVIGWRQTYAVLAVLSLVVGAASCLILSRQGAAASHVARPDGSRGIRAAAAIRMVRFWLIATACFLTALVGFGVAIHALGIYRELGTSPSALLLVTALLGIGSIVGRFGLGFVVDRFHAPLATAIIFASAGLAAMYLAMGGASPGAIFFLGLALGAESDVIVFLTRRYFGNVDHATIYNRLLAATYLGGMLGPAIVGASLASGHGYQPVLLGGSVLLLIAAALIVRIGEYLYPAHAGISEAA